MRYHGQQRQAGRSPRVIGSAATLNDYIDAHPDTGCELAWMQGVRRCTECPFADCLWIAKSDQWQRYVTKVVDAAGRRLKTINSSLKE